METREAYYRLHQHLLSLHLLTLSNSDRLSKGAGKCCHTDCKCVPDTKRIFGGPFMCVCSGLLFAFFSGGLFPPLFVHDSACLSAQSVHLCVNASAAQVYCCEADGSAPQVLVLNWAFSPDKRKWGRFLSSYDAVAGGNSSRCTLQNCCRSSR